jgi:hypothetical protein
MEPIQRQKVMEMVQSRVYWLKGRMEGGGFSGGAMVFY